ncbi:hypothetical protein MM440_03170 [Arsenicicoccus piscis]|uniref:AMIN-like domain-containing protein n=1 Tax=Arsenicicoccus piscis TaxID=673954 RepID=A0ABQ6HMH8_9MICO|nr:hypothetical protein [Arsenicicoccus piscis]MCH8626809.1 hypothetical protein [Arsenicicoccus piscis]GMA19293.1 hypothetical protein GCM10025862_13140 [Arsenicicoccus piscis]
MFARTRTSSLNPTLTTLSTAVAATLLAAGAAVTGLPGSVSPAAASVGTAAVHCPRGWGSLPQASTGTGTGVVTGVRSGTHPCYDRLVVDLGRMSGTVGYRAGYAKTFTTIASGETRDLRGAATLMVSVQAPAYDSSGRPTYVPANRWEVVSTSGYPTIKQVAWGGSFEGETLLGIGTRARLPMRVSVLTDGTNQRLVVDVAHRW